jgi:hypothetical protein
MRSASAFVVCLLLALVAGRAGAERCSQDIINGAQSSCSFTSAALGQAVTLTQACVRNSEIVTNSANPNTQYMPFSQPWAGASTKTVKAFIKEVHASCSFDYPNHVDVNTGPWACYKYGYKKAGYICYGATKGGAVKKHKTKNNDNSALLAN